MKRIIAFFVFIYQWIGHKLGFRGWKETEPIKVKPMTLAEKLEALEPEVKRKYRPQGLIPPHNNRKNTHGRYTQFTPGGKAIYHDIRN